MIIDYIKIEHLIKVMQYYKFEVFDNGSKPFNLNIVNIRNDSPNAGKFDDLQIIFWKTKAGWLYETFAVTTDPGIPYLLKPLNKKGTAIVAPGQYKAVWKLGLHKGKYEALVQNSPIIVIRDNNMDDVLDFVTMSFMNFNKVKEGLQDIPGVNKEIWFLEDENSILFQEGYFGINCHRASSWKILQSVGLYSAGCCVHQDPNRYNDFIELIKSAVLQWGNSFTAAWITETDYFNALHDIDPKVFPLKDKIN